MEFKIKLNDTNDVRNFVHICEKHIGAVTVNSEKYIVDGKSIMGVFSLDLTNPIMVKFENEVSKNIIDELNNYCIE